MTTVLKGLTAALGLWLVVAVSVFPAAAAIWIAFATAVGLAAVTSLDLIVRRRAPVVERLGIAATVGASAFLIVASLVFEGVSLGWLMAIAGASIQAVALVGLALPRLAEKTLVFPAPERAESRVAA